MNIFWAHILFLKRPRTLKAQVKKGKSPIL
jgi:hypothetical protein